MDAPSPATPAVATPTVAPRSQGALRHEGVLTGLLIVEIALFSVLGTNFFTLANAFEVVRVSAEIGLLALALTPVIVSAGIDLSVGSMMGLAAVVFGHLVKETGLSWAAAIPLVLGLGAAGGATNALLITRLRIPPLIVTLGTFSLFRGLAEGLTGGTKNYTDFPEPFLLFGQGYIASLIPPQVVVLLVAALVYAAFLHRTTLGRSIYAIGFSPEGARFAGIRVNARLGIVYVMSGLVASFAAILYVAHLGQAKADAGTSYELMAITAVVLGGTSIFGGRGTIAGTMLGLFAIAVLQNGLRLADLPTELAGILSGVLLVTAILLNQVLARRAPRRESVR